MATLQKCLIKLNALKTKAALDAVQTPGAVTGENYGIVVGVQRGLAMAEKLIQEALKEEEGRI